MTGTGTWRDSGVSRREVMRLGAGGLGFGLFGGIVACGLPDVEMTSIARESGRSPTLEEVGARVVNHFAEVFARRLAHDPELRPAPVEAAR